MIGIFKEQLKKTKATLSQLHVDEMVFELDARETSNGSTLDRFLGKGLRWDRYVDARDLIRQRREAKKKRVRKKKCMEDGKLVFSINEKVCVQ